MVSQEILVENCQAQSCDSLEKLRKEPICSMDIE